MENVDKLLVALQAVQNVHLEDSAKLNCLESLTRQLLSEIEFAQSQFAEECSLDWDEPIMVTD